MSFFDRLKQGLSKANTQLKEGLNVVLHNSPKVDEDFWDKLEETLIESDFGAAATMQIVGELRKTATRKAIPDAAGVLAYLADEIKALFTAAPYDIFGEPAACLVFVGINGVGKTTTCGKLAKQLKDAGKSVILGNADTYRAAAAEQLEVWSERAGVPLVTKERGADPAGVVYDTLNAAERDGVAFTLIDTAGRLHTSSDLMRELQKVVKVTRKRAAKFALDQSASEQSERLAQTAVLPSGEATGPELVSGGLPVYLILVLDATTGQNGLTQAREFKEAVDLDGLILTKLDGTAKGGIAVAISHELDLPILKVGVGEQIDDLDDFDVDDFVASLIGDESNEAS
ncbi:MAG: signal recognition particle-docking protein FtsY [Coriobacteriales bacterium]|jgi:fused signal recognition particle receptor|nr:signal recognition particle-docking protein FtsY [Coriobacteriales bacterium]